LLIDQSNPAILYATTLSGGQAFKSINGGESWSELRFGFPRLGGCGLAVNPADPSILYATSSVGPLKSTDAGRSWVKDNFGIRVFVGMDYPASMVDPSNPTTLYVGSGAGIFKSLDRGES